MRAFLYLNEYLNIIEKWKNEGKTFNPFKKRYALNMKNVVEKELYSKYPECENMSDDMKKIYLNEITKNLKEQKENNDYGER